MGYGFGSATVAAHFFRSEGEVLLLVYGLQKGKEVRADGDGGSESDAKSNVRVLLTSLHLP